EDAPALLGQLGGSGSGHGLQLVAVLGHLDGGQAMLVEHGLDVLDALGGSEGFLVGVGQRVTEQVERLGDALGLGGERLERDVLDLGQVGGEQRESDDGGQKQGAAQHGGSSLESWNVSANLPGVEGRIKSSMWYNRQAEHYAAVTTAVAIGIPRLGQVQVGV